MTDLISKQAVFDIVDDLRDRMTVEGYSAMVERVKALPSVQPNLQPTCNQLATDCISRLIDVDKLYESLMTIETDNEYNFCYPCKEILQVIKEQPTVTLPERKTGEWIEFDSSEDKYDVIKCPCCKHTFTVDSYHWTDIGFVKDDFKFCPNCGADMRGEQDG